MLKRCLLITWFTTAVALIPAFADAQLERTNVPELAKGRPPGHAAIKARRAWMEIARLLYSAVGEHRVVSIAAGVTFFVLLAMFPAIGALVSP
jgi:membrane protein